MNAESTPTQSLNGPLSYFSLASVIFIAGARLVVVGANAPKQSDSVMRRSSARNVSLDKLKGRDNASRCRLVDLHNAGRDLSVGTQYAPDRVHSCGTCLRRPRRRPELAGIQLFRPILCSRLPG